MNGAVLSLAGAKATSMTVTRLPRPKLMVRRSRAREVVLQLLFQWDQNPSGAPRAAVERFASDRLLGDAEMVGYALALFDGVAANRDRIDPIITSTATNWRLSRMMPVDRNVLRLGTYEL